ncbi:MAG: hypothetical protein PHF60_04610 [Candidatus ainarchaeum sp.]|nr:hypothetical protein [Candidatus ainarchaeum sp.]
MHIVKDNHTYHKKKTGLSAELEKLKALAETDNVRAPLRMRMEASTSLWAFADLRRKTTKGLSDIAPLLREGVPLPEELTLRLSKILLATVLMDKMAELRDAVMADPTLAKLELFRMTHAEVARVLSRGYLSKSLARIRKEYFHAESALIACSECCSVPFMPSDSVMKAQAAKAEALIDRFDP